MTGNIQAIAETFSRGEFKNVYNNFSDDIEWHIIGDRNVCGREHTIAFCDKMLDEIAGSALINTRTIVQEDAVAIEGYCAFTNADGKLGRVEYCDVYIFSQGMIRKITSYCITSVTEDQA